ncbi:ATP-binding protein [Sulfitobacter sp. D35]|uniref:sensor histidine kinase n=1 Tax=Sulfitobacter sp. D35 TaxID=3083252 RepID=UPI00296EFF42|nr:ATP-binding protein [Sulfitobacter sp. D35]MDW4497664.1 ATP-binding protein [Sulfitobacter sp. D35]
MASKSGPQAGAPPPGAGYDLTGLKAIDHFKSRELRLRLLMLATMAISVGIYYDDPVFLVAYIAYVLSLCGYVVLLHRQPDEVPRRVGHLLNAVGLVSVLIVQATCVYLFAFENHIAQLLGLFLYFVSSLNTVTVRAVRRTYLFGEVTSYGVAAAAMVLVEYLRHGGSESLLLGLAFVTHSIYFAFTVYGIQRFQRRLDAAREGEHAAERQRAIGQLTGGVAHDFNNLLTAVIGNLQLHREVEGPEERAALLAQAEAAAQKGAALTGQLLALSRQSQLTPETVDTDRIARDLARMVESLLGPRHRLVTDLPDTPSQVRVDAGMLQNVLINLILNARDAMPGGGDIRLTGEIDVDGGLTLTISDRGTGILPQHIDRVFEPYFTTKPVGQGSGLGLSMARGFMEQSGGTVELDSRPGLGTDVRLRFAPQT